MKHLTVNGADLACVDCGSGAPLVLVHGFPLNHAMWGEQIRALSAKRRVIAPDLRGFGASGPPGDKLTMDQFADDLAALLDGLGVAEPVALCGLSMGGYVAWQFWHRHRARLRALILCDTRAAADTPETAANRLLLAERVMREGPASILETMLPRLTAASTAQRRPEVIEALRQMILTCDPKAIAAASRGMAERPDMTPLLCHIDLPTLVLVGECDAISTPGEMRAIADAIPGSRFRTVASAGHIAPMENPAEVSAAIGAFLAELG